MDFNLAKMLCPPDKGAGIYLSKDGRWKLTMKNMSGDGPRTRSWSSAWSTRSDHEAYVYLLQCSWNHYLAHGGTAPRPKGI